MFFHDGRQGGQQDSFLLCRECQAPHSKAVAGGQDLIYSIASQQVQTGGSFDIDYEVAGPNDRVVMSGKKERQGDFVFTATETGDYRVCFDNEMSTLTDKMVDFELAVRPPPSHLFSFSRAGLSYPILQ